MPCFDFVSFLASPKPPSASRTPKGSSAVPTTQSTTESAATASLTSPSTQSVSALQDTLANVAQSGTATTTSGTSAPTSVSGNSVGIGGSGSSNSSSSSIQTGLLAQSQRDLNARDQKAADTQASLLQQHVQSQQSSASAATNKSASLSFNAVLKPTHREKPNTSPSNSQGGGTGSKGGVTMIDPFAAGGPFHKLQTNEKSETVGQLPISTTTTTGNNTNAANTTPNAAYSSAPSLSGVPAKNAAPLDPCSSPLGDGKAFKTEKTPSSGGVTGTFKHHFRSRTKNASGEKSKSRMIH